MMEAVEGHKGSIYEGDDRRKTDECRDVRSRAHKDHRKRAAQGGRRTIEDGVGDPRCKTGRLNWKSLSSGHLFPGIAEEI